MDDKRKRHLVAGVIVGAVSVGLIVLSRKTPRDQWWATLLRIVRDGLKLARGRYGSSELISASEGILDRLETAVEEHGGSLPRSSSKPKTA